MHLLRAWGRRRQHRGLGRVDPDGRRWRRGNGGLADKALGMGGVGGVEDRGALSEAF